MTSYHVIVKLCCVALLSTCHARILSNKGVRDNEVLKGGYVGNPRDCQDHWDRGERTPGVFTIYPNGTYPARAFCRHNETNTATVIQRRQDGKESFQRNWHDYKLGFGHPQGDYWIGLDTIHHLTSIRTHSLQLHMQDWSGRDVVMTYGSFIVSDEASLYRLYVNGPSGPVPDDLTYNNGMTFATYDRPDAYHCAINQRCGWWFNYCTYTSPNGKYYRGKYNPNPSGFYDGIYYKDWLGYDYSLKHLAMVLVIKP